MTNFIIPSEFQSEFEPISPKDTRTDTEILASLTTHHPVTSEKNIWAFWHAGLTSMPAWCIRNVLAWVRINDPSWTVRVLDTVPGSPNHALKFVSEELLPEAFVRGTLDGPYRGPHSADFLRGALLIEHGGIVLDVGCVEIRDFDRVCWRQLEDEETPYRVAVPLMYGQTMANHFVAARKNDPFMKQWHKVFTHLWKGRNNHEGISASPLLAFVREISFDEAADFTWDFKIPATEVMEYIAQVMCFRRLTMLEDDGEGFNPSEYWQKHIFCFNSLQENWGGEATVGFYGPRMFELFQVRLDADQESEDYKDAYKLVWRLLTKSSMQKVTHGKGLTHTPHLGRLWDDNDGKDCEPGTFGELLRYGCLHFRQKRESVLQMEAKKSPIILNEGLLG